MEIDTKRIRLEALMTQQQFADALQVTTITVSSWERGLRHPSLTQLSAISKFCKEHKIKFKEQ